MHVAALKGHDAIVFDLLRSGADIFAVDKVLVTLIWIILLKCRNSKNSD
jgi:ankyrin repeat protein